jgi:AraC-like DNA-binding protein
MRQRSAVEVNGASQSPPWISKRPSPAAGGTAGLCQTRTFLTRASLPKQSLVVFPNQGAQVPSGGWSKQTPTAWAPWSSDTRQDLCGLWIIMGALLQPSSREGLEQPCGRLDGDWTCSTPPGGGVELLRAWFGGRAYSKHRHDTYAICITDLGIQTFDYRGATRTSLPGQIVVLHPDETHDGRAGSEAGFGYRIVYLAPSRVADAARSLCDAAVALPYVREPVSVNVFLAKAVTNAFLNFPSALEPLAIDELIEGVTRGLLLADASIRNRRRRVACDLLAVDRVRQFLEAEKTRIVSSAELEEVSGHCRFSLTRQFRQRYGTSPYRYLIMRRLDVVRSEIGAGKALAPIAIDAGFADQAHMTRMFRAAYGLSPSQFRTLAQPRPR